MVGGRAVSTAVIWGMYGLTKAMVRIIDLSGAHILDLVIDIFREFTIGLYHDDIN